MSNTEDEEEENSATQSQSLVGDEDLSSITTPSTLLPPLQPMIAKIYCNQQILFKKSNPLRLHLQAVMKMSIII